MGSPMPPEATEKDSGMIFSPSLFIPHPADRTGDTRRGRTVAPPGAGSSVYRNDRRARITSSSSFSESMNPSRSPA